MEPEIIKLIGYAIVTVMISLSIWYTSELYISKSVDHCNEEAMIEKEFHIEWAEHQVRMATTSFYRVLSCTTPNVSNGCFQSLERQLKKLELPLYNKVLAEIGEDWKTVCEDHIIKIQQWNTTR